MIHSQQRSLQNRLGSIATAAIMFGGAVFTPHAGVAAPLERDNFVKATIEACERKNEAGESNSKLKKLGLYGTTGTLDLAGGSGVFSFGAFIVDTLFNITGFTPTDCKLYAEVEAYKRKWPDVPQTEPAASPPATTPEQVLREEGMPKMASSPPSLGTPLSDEDRAFIREFKSAMVMRGKFLTKKSRKTGHDLGAPHRELVQFMDSVANDQWDTVNRGKLKARLELMALEDKTVAWEAKRIARKVATDFNDGASRVARKSPVYDPHKVLEVLSQPVPERLNAPPQRVLDTRHEMG